MYMQPSDILVYEVALREKQLNNFYTWPDKPIS